MSFDLTRSVPVNSPLSSEGSSGGGAGRATSRGVEGGSSFADTLKGYLKEVGNLEKTAETQVQNLAEGRTADVHQVMLAVEEANLALDMLIQIRNRLLDAYKTLTSTSM